MLRLRSGQGTHRRLHECIPSHSSESCTDLSTRQKRVGGDETGRLCYFADIMQSPCEEYLLALHPTSIPPSLYLNSSNNISKFLFAFSKSHISIWHLRLLEQTFAVNITTSLTENVACKMRETNLQGLQVVHEPDKPIRVDLE